MTVVTFFAETDGGAISGQNASYAAARSTSTASDDSSGNAYCGQSTSFQVMRSYFRFDTSSLPDGATVTDVKLYLKVHWDYSTTDFVVQIFKFDWSTPLGSSREANYDASGAVFDQNWRSTSGLAVGTYYANSTTLDVTHVNKTGYTYYMLKSEEDTNNSTPGASEYVFFYTSDAAGTSSDPYLEVTYNEATPITQTQALTWDIRALVAQTQAFVWDIGGVVTQTQAFVWDIGVPVVQSQVFQWDLLGVITKAQTFQWDLGNALTQSQIFSWRMTGAWTSPPLFVMLPDNAIEVAVTDDFHLELPDNAIEADLGDNQV